MRRAPPASSPPSPQPPSTSPTLAGLLDEALSRARAAGAKIGATQAAEAEILGVSPSYLSKLRNGKAPITEAFAASFAEKLEPSDRARRRTLEQELLRTREGWFSASEDEPAAEDPLPRVVTDFFDRLGQPGSLVCVDYRDLPQAVSTGSYPSAARDAATAVARGLSFAMFQPFGPVEELRDRRNAAAMNGGVSPPFERLFDYLYKLAQDVRRVHLEMLAAAERIARERGEPMLGQIVLYEAESAPKNPAGCGIQSRTFYVDHWSGAHHLTDIYEWIVGADGHSFVQRSGESLHADAVREQFYPVPDLWREHGQRLPVRKKELDDFCNHRSFPNHWNVWKPSR